MPASLTVRIQEKIKKAINTAVKKERLIEGRTDAQTAVVIDAVTRWLDRHEGRTTGGEKRPKGKAKAHFM